MSDVGDASQSTSEESSGVSYEMELAGSEALVPGDVGLQEELAAERALWRSVVWGVVIATPVCIGIWAAIVALAVAGNHPDWWAWLGMGALVGVLAGAFFGGWAGFTMKAHVLDEVDRRAHG